MFKLPELPYDYSALEPHIDTKTMEIHHSKHHAGYVENLNKALSKYEDLQKLAIEELLKNSNDLPEDIRQTVINNAGGHANHSLFWEILSPKGGGKPTGELAKAIESQFGSFEKFKEEFSTKATTLFGSGWVFLNVCKDKSLEIKRHSFQNSPLLHGKTPIFGLDVWEHAYYLKYQNKRSEYVDAFWNIVNWDKVLQNYEVLT